MSLLLSEGHTEARKYPLAMLWHEANIVRARLHSIMRTEAILIQGAIASMLSKKGADGFEKTLKVLTDGTE